MRQWLRTLILCVGLGLGLWPAAGAAQGTIPIALVQQMNLNGTPLAGCLVYFYQAGTVSTPQNEYIDFGLTTPGPNPLTCDQYGRVPMFWLANGLIHVRLTDPSGLVELDTTMQVLGPSTGGGGGGGTIDPTTIASTGDVKFRMTAETVTGWVKLNGTTIGNATSGASGRANADTQNLFVYLWTNCTNGHCPVSGGRGATALADYTANKTLQLENWQDSTPIGRDCMDTSPCAGKLLSRNISSGGGDTVDTPGAFGGAPNTAIALGNLPNVSLTSNAPGTINTNNTTIAFWGGGQAAAGAGTGAVNASAVSVGSASVTLPQIVTPLGGSGTLFPNISSFQLGTWYQKL